MYPEWFCYNEKTSRNKQKERQHAQFTESSKSLDLGFEQRFSPTNVALILSLQDLEAEWKGFLKTLERKDGSGMRVASLILP